MKSKYRFKRGINTILNENGSHHTAAFSFSTEHIVDLENKTEDFAENWISSTLAISDCNRSINLNFDIYEEGDEQRALNKMSLLVEKIQECEQILKQTIADKIRVDQELGLNFLLRKDVQESNLSSFIEQGKGIKNKNSKFKEIENNENEKN